MARGVTKGEVRRGSRTAKVEPPQIFVCVGSDEGGESGSPKYSQAHFRNRGGYLYLCWRDGERVRELYLGKGRKVSPTVSGRGRAAVKRT